MQTHLVIENIFDKTELAKHIAKLQALMQLGEAKVGTVMHPIKVDASEAAAVIAEGVQHIEAVVAKAHALPGVDSTAAQDLALAHTVFGTGDAVNQTAPLPPSAAVSTADAVASTTAPAAAQATSAPTVAPPVPSATSAAATQGPASGGEIDRNGFPYDPRIHAGTKTKNKDGTWKYLRGVADSLVDEVENAYRAARGLVAPAPATQTAPPPPPVSAPAPAEGSAPPPPPAAPDAPGVSFGQLVARTQKLMQARTWLVPDMQAALKQVGLPDFPSLKARPDLFGQFDALLSAAELGAV